MHLLDIEETTAKSTLCGSCIICPPKRDQACTSDVNKSRIFHDIMGGIDIDTLGAVPRQALRTLSRARYWSR